MVPKIHPKGRSFKGAAAYLLHDIDADTSKRVAWTATKNLAVEDPEVAWRIMAATAMNADGLKRQAGVKNTGRKSDQSVLHLTLSWHPDEGKHLDPDQMLGSAEAALLALGASDRQALIVCHDDKGHAHVHVLVNRMSSEDGRMLSSSFERLKASEWAQKYEEARGQIFCHERVVNNAARKRGEYTRGRPNEPRHLHEQARQASNDNAHGRGERTEVRAAFREERRKDQEVGKSGRRIVERHARQWGKLEAEHRQRLADIRQGAKAALAQRKDAIRQEYRPRWTQLHHEQQAGQQAFEHREATLLGRIRNRFRSIDLGRIVTGQEKGRALSEAFEAMTSRTARIEAERRRQREAEQRLRSEQAAAEKVASAEQRAKRAAQLETNRRRYVVERADLILRQQMEQAAQRAAWRERQRQRRQALEKDRQIAPPPPVRRADTQPTHQPPSNIKSADLLPQDHAAERARQIEAFKNRMRERAAERERNRDRDDRDR